MPKLLSQLRQQSAVPPAVVKLQLRDLERTGSTVGNLSAWSTGGAIVGTFLAGYVLVAFAAVTVLRFGSRGLRSRNVHRSEDEIGHHRTREKGPRASPDQGTQDEHDGQHRLLPSRLRPVGRVVLVGHDPFSMSTVLRDPR